MTNKSKTTKPTTHHTQHTAQIKLEIENSKKQKKREKETNQIQTGSVWCGAVLALLNDYARKRKWK